MGARGVGEGAEVGGAGEVTEGVGEATAGGVPVAAAGGVMVSCGVEIASVRATEDVPVAASVGVATKGGDALQAADKSNVATNATKLTSRCAPTIDNRCALCGIRSIGQVDNVTFTEN